MCHAVQECVCSDLTGVSHNPVMTLHMSVHQPTSVDHRRTVPAHLKSGGAAGQQVNECFSIAESNLPAQAQCDGLCLGLWSQNFAISSLRAKCGGHCVVMVTVTE